MLTANNIKELARRGEGFNVELSEVCPQQFAILLRRCAVLPTLPADMC